MIYFIYNEYINMHYYSNILFLDGLVKFVEDDLFRLTLGCDLEMNCIVLTQLAWLVCKLLFYVLIMLIMRIF